MSIGLIYIECKRRVVFKPIRIHNTVVFNLINACRIYMKKYYEVQLMFTKFLWQVMFLDQIKLSFIEYFG